MKRIKTPTQPQGYVYILERELDRLREDSRRMEWLDCNGFPDKRKAAGLTPRQAISIWMNQYTREPKP